MLRQAFLIGSSVLVLGTALLVTMVGPTLAQSTCVEPFAPSIPNGASVTKDQLLSTQDDVRAFIKASDEYQTCLLIDLKRRAEQAQKTSTDGTIDPRMLTAVADKRRRNQDEKERVGVEFNAAVKAFNAAHATQP